MIVSFNGAPFVVERVAEQGKRKSSVVGVLAGSAGNVLSIVKPALQRPFCPVTARIADCHDPIAFAGINSARSWVLLFGTNLSILPGAHLEHIIEDEFPPESAMPGSELARIIGR